MTSLTPRRHPAHARMKSLRARLGTFQYLCSGSLQRRWMSCGRDYCGCKKDEEQRHGPYYYWNRLQKGKRLSQLLSPAQAQIVRQAIDNNWAIKRILRSWERETIKVLQASKDADRR